jgi:hypothetical protein
MLERSKASINLALREVVYREDLTLGRGRRRRNIALR